MNRTCRQKLGDGALGLQLLDKTGKAFKSTCTVDFCLLAQFNNTGHVWVVVLFHDLQLVSRIGKQQIAQRRRQHAMVITRTSMNLRRLNRLRSG